MAVVQDKLQLLMNQSRVDRSKSDGKKLYFINNDKQKKLESYRNHARKLYLRLKSEDGGYQPILGGLKAIQIEYLANCIRITLTDEHLKITELYLTNINYEKT